MPAAYVEREDAMEHRRRLRTTRPLRLDETLPDWDQPTVPMNVDPISDWRTDSVNRAVNTRVSWGKVLDAERAAGGQVAGKPLRFLPASLGEIVRVWLLAGGGMHAIARPPLLFARYSYHGAPPLLLISVVALALMTEQGEYAERLRVAVEGCVTWLRSRATAVSAGDTSLTNVLVLTDCPPECRCPYPDSYTFRDDLDDSRFADIPSAVPPPDWPSSLPRSGPRSGPASMPH
jgi:hypothetical protein